MVRTGRKSTSTCLLAILLNITSCRPDLINGTSRILFLGDSFLSGGLGVPDVTASILQSLTSHGSTVNPLSYSPANSSWVQQATDATTPGSQLYQLLGAGSNASLDYVVFQEDSMRMASCVSNATLARQEADALVSLIDLAEAKNASSLVLLTPAEYTGAPALAANFPNIYKALQNQTNVGYVTVDRLAEAASGRNISMAPAGLAYETVYDIAVGLVGRSQALQLPAGAQTPLLLYQAGFQQPSVVGSYLVGLTIASTLTGCHATGKAVIPAGLVGTAWPNLLQTASDSIVFGKIYNPAGYPDFPWTYQATVCTP